MDEKGLTPEERAALVGQIERLREEHRDLDSAIEALRDAGQPDQLQLQRLKKRKLMLRDKLARLEDQMCCFAHDFDRDTAGYSPDRVDALVWALTELLVVPVAGEGIFEAYRRLAQTGHDQQEQKAP